MSREKHMDVFRDKAGKARLSDRPPGRPFVDDFLSYLLSRAADQVSARFHKVAKERGLGVAEWRVLGSLWNNPSTVGELAGFTLYQQPTLTKIIDRMVKAGLVERHGDPEDRRRVHVRLTAQGRAVAAELLPIAKAQEAAMLSGYSEAEIRVLKDALKLLIERTDDAG